MLFAFEAGDFLDEVKLEDGTELLWEQHHSGPDDVYVVGIESYDHLSEAAKEKILSFYEKQGLLYSIPEELEKAYAAYLQSENKNEFQPYTADQQTVPTASSERILYFLTSVTLSASENYTELRLGAAFDRETGEQLSTWELFSDNGQNVKQLLLDIAGVTDPVLRSEMEAAFQPEYIILFPDHLDISFPQGTLPSQEHSYQFGITYEGRLHEIMHNWAIPKTPN